MRLQLLIDQAVSIAGSRSEVARALGVRPGNVTDWHKGRRPCPDRHVLGLAKLAGKDPMREAAAVYLERLGKSTKNTAKRAGVMSLAFACMALGAPFVAVERGAAMYRRSRRARAIGGMSTALG